MTSLFSLSALFLTPVHLAIQAFFIVSLSESDRLIVQGAQRFRHPGALAQPPAEVKAYARVWRIGGNMAPSSTFPSPKRAAATCERVRAYQRHSCGLTS